MTIRLIKASHRIPSDEGIPSAIFCKIVVDYSNYQLVRTIRINVHLWTHVGLYNGATGFVYDIIDIPSNNKYDLPRCVLVQMNDNYIGAIMS